MVIEVLRAVGKNVIFLSWEELEENKFPTKYRWDFALYNLQKRIEESVYKIFERISIHGLIELEESSVRTYILDYTI